MACVNANGQLTESARALLGSIADQEKTAEQISKQIQTPLFKIRSSLREMLSIGLVAEHDGAYMANEKAKEMLNK
ncbi:hypothetical protein [Ferviditalea candida]|uniref:Uncharacterized protein n=1 Tax=Ferviditalea candida TaxID=3108399 RepID=A0ABU5ZJA2_9BACL|nr:hypothetical protein [Paenibacillaceae bacterium T2]